MINGVKEKMDSKTILLSSTKRGSGKSVVAIGAFLKYKENGLNPGYFKPIGDSSTIKPRNLTDKDASIIVSILARKFSQEQICPQLLNPHYFLDEILPDETLEIFEKITDAFENIASKTDVIIIEGNHDYMQYSAIQLDDVHIAKKFDAKVIICAPIANDTDIDDLLSAIDSFKQFNCQVGGVILSPLNPTAEQRIRNLYIPLLKNRDITVIGGLKNAKTLEKPTIAEILDAIDGKLLTGDFIRIKNNKVDGFVIGAMHSSKALDYIKRAPNVCVITGGDRTDIALNALETQISLLIFTGNIRPDSSVISKAKEKHIPTIIAAGDTFSITEKLQNIHSEIQPDEIEICFEQVDQNIDWNEFVK
ncbi:DRTGG domain-containing protein [Candidatus Harpocratesius sp.]